MIAGQIVGFVAMAIAMMSFQARRGKYIMLYQGIAASFWIFHYVLIGSYSGAAMNFVALVRNFVYMYKDKMSKRVSIATTSITALAFIVVGAVTWQGPITIVPVIGSLAATVAFFMKNENMLRTFSMIVSIMWLIYNITQFSIAGALNESLALVSIIVALIRYRNLYSKTVNGEHASEDAITAEGAHSAENKN